MVKAVICDVWRGNAWEEIDIAEALPIRSEFLMRCCQSRGRARVHKKANNGMQANFEHRAAHEGCSISTRYSGPDSLHPNIVPDKPDLSRYKLRRSTRAPA